MKAYWIAVYKDSSYLENLKNAQRHEFLIFLISEINNKKLSGPP